MDSECQQPNTQFSSTIIKGTGHRSVRTECQRYTGLCIGGSGWVDRNRANCAFTSDVCRPFGGGHFYVLLPHPRCSALIFFYKITSCSFLHPVFSIFYKYPII